jgi:hypothetical protein
VQSNAQVVAVQGAVPSAESGSRTLLVPVLQVTGVEGEQFIVGLRHRFPPRVGLRRHGYRGSFPETSRGIVRGYLRVPRRARNAEEQKANKVLAELEKTDLSSEEFDVQFAQFQQDVLAHAGREEAMEFPALEAGCTPEQRQTMGRRLLTAERAAPTDPHPTAAGSPVLQWTLGPFASLLDRARDALGTRP